MPGILNTTIGLQLLGSGSGAAAAVFTMSQPKPKIVPILLLDPSAPSTAAITPTSDPDPKSPLKMSDTVSNFMPHAQEDPEWIEVPDRTSTREPDSRNSTLIRHPDIDDTIDQLNVLQKLENFCNKITALYWDSRQMLEMDEDRFSNGMLFCSQFEANRKDPVKIDVILETHVRLCKKAKNLIKLVRKEKIRPGLPPLKLSPLCKAFFIIAERGRRPHWTDQVILVLTGDELDLSEPIDIGRLSAVTGEEYRRINDPHRFEHSESMQKIKAYPIKLRDVVRFTNDLLAREQKVKELKMHHWRSVFLRLYVDLTKGNPVLDPDPRNGIVLGNLKENIRKILVEARKRAFHEVAEISILEWGTGHLEVDERRYG